MATTPTATTITSSSIITTTAAETSSSRDDFDRSFEYWSQVETTTPIQVSSISQGGGGYSGGDVSHYSEEGGISQLELSWMNNVDPMWESSNGHGILDFYVTNEFRGHDDDKEEGYDLFPKEEPFASVASSLPSSSSTSFLERNSTIEITVHEQFSVQYNDDVSPSEDRSGSCHVEGTISLQSCRSVKGIPFRLTLRDALHQLDRLELNQELCSYHNGPNSISSSSLPQSQELSHDVDTAILCVHIPNTNAEDEDDDECVSDEDLNQRVKLASYWSSTRLVPLLVKSRVQATPQSTRVGLKIRANPRNGYDLHQLVVMLAVPPCVKGHSVRMSQPGGLWSEMRRTLCWSVPNLEPGHAIEIQLQFEWNDKTTDAKYWEQNPAFPVLVRADCPSLLSNIELQSDCSDNAQLVNTNVSVSARILHRRV